MNFLYKARETIRRYGLIEKGDKIVIGVSGGPDSVALLYLFNDLKTELDLCLHVAHLDHAIRPDSYKDKEFVEDLCFRLKLPVTTYRLNISRLAKKGSLEEAWRNARFDFFFKVAKRIKAKKIALGHNLDDQAETVLMRILRGTGLYGLSGILPKRNIAGFQIIRPLIETPRNQIESFLKKKRIKTRLDSSNVEDIYFRNRIRHNLLPLMEKEYNKNIKEILSNMAENVGYDYEYLNQAAERAVRKLGPKIKLDGFLKLHPAIQRLVLRLNIAKVKGDMRRISFQHIKEIEDLILNRPLNSIVDLPKGVALKKKKKTLLIYRR